MNEWVSLTPLWVFLDSTMGVFDFTISAPVSIAISLVSLVESSLLELDGVPGFL